MHSGKVKLVECRMIEYVYKHGGSAIQRRTPGVGKRTRLDYKSLSTSINTVGVP